MSDVRKIEVTQMFNLKIWDLPKRATLYVQRDTGGANKGRMLELGILQLGRMLENCNCRIPHSREKKKWENWEYEEKMLKENKRAPGWPSGLIPLHFIFLTW